MPSVRYYNSTAPFWDFVAEMENNGLGRQTNGNAPDSGERPNPWTEGWAGFPWGPFPHRGHHGPFDHHGPPPPQHEGPPPPPEGEKDAEAGPSDARDSAEDQEPSDDNSHRRHHRHGHGHGPHRSRSGFCGARGGRRGAWGGPGGRGAHGWHPYAAAAGPFGGLAELFQNQLFGNGENEGGAAKNTNRDDFTPEADVFDTPSAFVVHVVLAGAKKEDVGVHWDAEKSELNIAGVVHRPGDEEFLKTLAMDGRSVGAFERKVRLGSRANPASVDVDGITARLEDGVLTVEVPKLESGFVEVRKVDVE